MPASALRHYERKGLIQSEGRVGLRRLFEISVLKQLELIALGQAAGFSLDQIAAMFGSSQAPVIDRALLRDKARELDRVIKRLTALRDGLAHAAVCHAAVCQAPHHLECPSFRRSMGWAATATST